MDPEAPSHCASSLTQPSSLSRNASQATVVGTWKCKIKEQKKDGAKTVQSVLAICEFSVILLPTSPPEATDIIFICRASHILAAFFGCQK